MTEDYPEGHDDILYKTNCPKCQADWPEARAFAVYADGHGHCHKCGHHTKPGSGRVEGQDAGASNRRGPAQKVGVGRMTGQLIPHQPGGDSTGLDKRRLKPATLTRFGYFLAPFGDQRVTAHVAPYFDLSGNLVAQKLRLPNKDFVTLGDTKLVNHQLFGQQAFGERNDLRVVVTEGELDAMSVAQATDFKFPAVSVNGGAKSARKCLQTNYRWLDRFKEIVLWFDDDDEGKAALAECAPLFAHGKVKVAKVAGFKDASDVLQANRPGDIGLAVFGATTWSPVGIVNAANCADDVAFKDVPAWSYPFADLQERTKGARRGEVIYHVAGTGVGKTTILFEVLHHFLYGDGHTESPAKIGFLGFEGTRRDVILGFMSVSASRRLHLDPLDEPAMRELHKAVFGTGRVELFDQETADWGYDAILGYIRYMAKALDCNIIVLDPLSIIAAGLTNVANKVDALDKISADLAREAKALGIHLMVAHHLKRVSEGKSHEEGGQTSLAQLRGSGNIANFASGVIGYERDQQAEGDKKTLTAARLLKNRFVGWTGLGGFLQYDSETGRTYAIPYAEGMTLWGDDTERQAASPFSPDQDF